MSDTWRARMIADHEREMVQGLHDVKCEWRARGFWLCHCSKRRRERSGLVTLPTAPLEFPPPDCPVCDREVEFDGDRWCCRPCHLDWDGHGVVASFSDDYGDDLLIDLAKWEAQWAAEDAKT